ncbi:MAG: molecular chaperone TorD family protein [Dehalococcoidales bacterium]|nr:molecular chaperone TorD family protein [Dehalococcoidales bacterium]
MLSKETKQLCRLFAETLDYPDNSSTVSTANCAQQLEQLIPGTAGPVRSFAGFIAKQSLEEWQELYAETFDITPASTLYVGYHLFGDTPKRSIFLIKLREAYQTCSFSGGAELADHLGVVLRFISVAEDPEFVSPLVEECLLPVLAQIEKELKKTDNQYALVIGPLQDFLQHVSRQLMKTGGVSNA